eukprot:1087053-Rhodomonas_salina.2
MHSTLSTDSETLTLTRDPCLKRGGTEGAELAPELLALVEGHVSGVEGHVHAACPEEPRRVLGAERPADAAPLELHQRRQTLADLLARRLPRPFALKRRDQALLEQVRRQRVFARPAP